MYAFCGNNISPYVLNIPRFNVRQCGKVVHKTAFQHYILCKKNKIKKVIKKAKKSVDKVGWGVVV